MYSFSKWCCFKCYSSPSSGGALTYEGRFPILCLSGFFIPTDNGGTKRISGGLTITLLGLDGRMIGGGLGGLLIASGPVQVMIESFLTGNQQEPKLRQQRPEFAPTFSHVPAINHNYAGGNDAVYTAPLRSITPASYHGNNTSAGNVSGHTIVAAKNNTYVPGKGQIVAVAAEKNISLPREGLTAEAVDGNMSLAGGGQTIVAAGESLPRGGQNSVHRSV